MSIINLGSIKISIEDNKNINSKESPQEKNIINNINIEEPKENNIQAYYK